MNRIDKAILAGIVLLIIPGAIPLTIIGIIINKLWKGWKWGK